MKNCLVFACVLFGCAQDAESSSLPATGSADAGVTAAPRTSGAPAGEMKRLRKALAHSTQNLHVERRSERLHVDMKGTFQTAAVIAFDPEGRSSRLCLENTVQLDHMLGESP